MKTKTILFLILILALTLRLPHLFDKNFGIDERLTTVYAKLIKDSAEADLPVGKPLGWGASPQIL